MFASTMRTSMKSIAVAMVANDADAKRGLQLQQQQQPRRLLERRMKEIRGCYYNLLRNGERRRRS
jgi:hypothetical protein